VESPRKSPERSPLWRLVPLVQQHKLRFWGGMSLINFGRLLEAFMPLYLKMGIDRIAAGDMRLAHPALAILGLMVVRYVAFNYGRRYVREVGVEIAFNLRQRLYWHLELMGPRFFSQFPTGDLMARAINDIALIRQLIGMGTRLLFVLGFSGIIAFIFMFYQSASLTLMLLPALPVFAIIGWILAKKIFNQSTLVQEGFSTLSAQVQENLNGIRTIQTHAQEDREIDRFEATSDAYARDYYKLMFLNSGLTSAMLIATGFTTLLVVGYGGSAAARIFEILDREPEIRDAPDAAPLDEIGGAITLHHLSYVHPARTGDGWPALNDLSLEIGKGEMVAVLGRVGSGKSTLLRLIVRLLDPPPGSVYLDGRDIRMLPLAQVRGQVAMVPQDPFLFATHIAQNISYDNPARETEEVWRAAESADLETTIRRFPDRLETMVGERGVTLSGGQKQRASLARGLIRETPVLLLDDCFSSVDTETEEFILSRLKTLRKGRTTIMVSHRVSTARHADRIVVLEEGRVAEVGTHAELLAKGGLYATLERQQGRRDELVQSLGSLTGTET